MLASRSGRVPQELADRGASGIAFDRNEPGAIAKGLGAGADLLLDTVAYDEAHADQLIATQGSVGQFVVISSASVYRDDAGRTLDEARANGFPELPVPVTEAQPTVDPGPASYSTRKAAMERRLIDRMSVPVTILRPAAIHGPNSRQPREWWFVKRLLDGRTRIPLAYHGASRFHTAGVANIAALVAAVAERPGTRLLNAIDPDAPTVIEIGEAVMTALGRRAELVPVPDEGFPPSIGASPWSVPHPIVLSDAAARAIGSEPVSAYAEGVVPAVRWLADGAAGDDWKRAFPILAAYPMDLFDYTAEDAWLARTSTVRTRP